MWLVKTFFCKIQICEFKHQNNKKTGISLNIRKIPIFYLFFYLYCFNTQIPLPHAYIQL